MTDPKTISFVGTIEIKNWLKQWAKQDDRTVSATLRRILEQEAQRRNTLQKQEVMYQTH